ncbi:MAG: hypothetical protein U1D55_18065 [Phycisphaerae bacterium]
MRTFGVRLSTACLSLFVLLNNIAGCPASGDSETNAGLDAGTGTSTGTVGTGTGTGGGTGTDAGAGSGGADTKVAPSVPILFVGSKGGGILSFRNPAKLDGNVAPSTRIFGAFNVREDAVGLSVDRAGNLISMSSDIGIAVFADAESATGDLTPGRRLTGSDTELTHSSTLNSAMIYDRDADRVFACNSGAVLVWDSFSSFGSRENVAPSRIITSPDLKSPRGLALAANGDLYVTATTQVAVFANAAARSGDIKADRIIRVLDESSVIAGRTITVDTVCVDRADRLYVFDSDPGALIFVLDNASTLDGVFAPNRTIDIELPQISASSFAPEFFPSAMVIDSNGTGYVSDFGQDAIRIIPNIGTRNGTLPAEQTIVGSNTHFDEIGGLYLWE